jgi:hypothetical protein
MTWWDISADLHTEEPIKPTLAELVGWIEFVDRKIVTLTYCRYLDGCDLKDGISLPRGVIESVERI